MDFRGIFDLSVQTNTFEKFKWWLDKKICKEFNYIGKILHSKVLLFSWIDRMSKKSSTFVKEGKSSFIWSPLGCVRNKAHWFSTLWFDTDEVTVTVRA